MKKLYTVLLKRFEELSSKVMNCEASFEERVEYEWLDKRLDQLELT